MKKLLSALFAVLMVLSMSTVAMAAAICEPSEAYAGTRVTIDGFYNDTYGSCDDIGTKYLTYDNYQLINNLSTSSKEYVSELRIDESKHEVYMLIVSPLPSSKEKEISGSVVLRDKDTGIKYTAEIEKGDLVINPDYKDANLTNMLYLGDKEFGLPYDYQTYPVEFKTSNGDTYGKFYADFEDDAYLKVTVMDQDPLYLGYNTTKNSTVKSKYTGAAMRFLTWTSSPTFDIQGTLGIYMDKDEWIYGINSDGTLYRLGGTYNTTTKAYEIKTATLGSYVISDTQLLTGTASSTPASSSSAASVPASSSSAASTPASSSDSSSSEAPASESPSSESSAPASSESSSKPTEAPAEDTKSSFPVVPILVVALAVVIIVLILILYSKNKRSRKPRFDDWDDDGDGSGDK